MSSAGAPAADRPVCPDCGRVSPDFDLATLSDEGAGVTFIEFPLTLGVVGALLLRVWAAIAAVAAIVTDAVTTLDQADGQQRDRSEGLGRPFALAFFRQ